MLLCSKNYFSTIACMISELVQLADGIAEPSPTPTTAATNIMHDLIQ